MYNAMIPKYTDDMLKRLITVILNYEWVSLNNYSQTVTKIHLISHVQYTHKKCVLDHFWYMYKWPPGLVVFGNIMQSLNFFLLMHSPWII